MSKIARIELFHVAIPLPAPFYPSWIPGLPQTENRFDLIRVTTQSGVTGVSAGPAMGREREGLGDLLGPYLIGEEATDIELVQERLREIAYLGQRHWWVEPAFWDILGKMEQKPVYELLGGKAATVNLYASTGEVKRVKDRIEEAEKRYIEGFRSIKFRVHDFDEALDIRRVVEPAKAVGSRMKIGVDANQAWRVAVIADAPRWDLARAKRFCDACAGAGVAWIEEPLPMDAYEDLAALSKYSQVPVAGGELHSSGLPELRHMMEKGCYKIFQPDALFTGGIAQTFEVIRLCRERGLSYTPHTWTNGIGFAVNLQLFAASGFAETMDLEYPLAPPGWTVAARDRILTEPFLHKKGTLRTPAGPGLGILIDKRALKKYGHRFFVMDKKRLVLHSLRTRGLRVSAAINREIGNRRIKQFAERGVKAIKREKP